MLPGYVCHQKMAVLTIEDAAFCAHSHPALVIAILKIHRVQSAPHLFLVSG